MQTETLAIVRPPTTGDQNLASRLSKGFRDASRRVAVYSSPEVSALAPEDLGNTTLVVVSPGQCIETSGNEGAFLSKVARARKRILASVGPVHGLGYLSRLRRGIYFDALFDLGFVSQKDSHYRVTDLAYHFVFNGLTREEEPLAQEPVNRAQRTIPWVLIGPRSDRNRELLWGTLRASGRSRGLLPLASPAEELRPRQSRCSVARNSRRSCRRPDTTCGAQNARVCIMRVSVLSYRCWPGRCHAR